MSPVPVMQNENKCKKILLVQYKSRDSAVGIATGYGLDDQEVGVRVLLEARIFTSPFLPDRLWGPPSLLSSGGEAAGVQLTTHLQLVPRSSKRVGSIHPLPHKPSWCSA
jgi:hypothetical protein